MADEARFVVTPDGVVEEADAGALELLGVTLEELRAAPRGAFNASGKTQAVDALRAAWAASGATAAIGETAVRRADGTIVPVRFVAGVRDDGKYLIGVRRLEGRSPTHDLVFSSAGQALTAWRTAERRLEDLVPGGVEWERVQAEVALLRSEYRRLFEARRT